MGMGYSLVAGLDEVGRGPLAGPVVAGAVVLPRNPSHAWIGDIRDSKAMTRHQREEIAPRLEKEALAAQTGAASAAEIDRVGIVEATRLAMKRALYSLPLLPQYLLLDAFPLPNVDLPQKAIVKGDARCLSIAAASIVAKVARDRMMDEADEIYPGYGFARNKGYATREHLRVITERGPCPIHRLTFSPMKGAAAAP